MISDKLIKYLEGKFPDKSPDLKDTEKEIWVKVGQISVVKHLKNLQEDQENNPLDITILKELK